MAKLTLDSESELRDLAHARLAGSGAQESAGESALSALRVLHDLAASSATAPDALALLHELQVHQVELELQDENLRGALAEVEAALHRQTQLYENAPFGYCTVDAETIIHELNMSGAELLGFEREDLLGRTFERHLAPQCVEALHATLARIAQGGGRESCSLRLLARDRTERTVLASIVADPEGRRFLIGFLAT